MTEPFTALAPTAVNADLAFALEVLSPPQYAAIVDHVTAEVRSQEANRLAGKQQQINRLLTEQESFEQRVRSELEDFLVNQRGIDVSEVNDLLISLDLDPIEQEFEVDVKVVAWQNVTITVKATSREAAESAVNDGDEDARNGVDNELSSYDWEVEEYEVTEVRDSY